MAPEVDAASDGKHKRRREHIFRPVRISLLGERITTQQREFAIKITNLSVRREVALMIPHHDAG